MKVKDLVAHLLAGDQEAEVLRIGHYGEPYQFTKWNFSFHKNDDGSSSLIISPPEIRVHTCPFGG